MFVREKNEVERRERAEERGDRRIYFEVRGEVYAMNVVDTAFQEAVSQDVDDFVLKTESFFLKMKTNDPRHFSPTEARAFDESDTPLVSQSARSL